MPTIINLTLGQRIELPRCPGVPGLPALEVTRANLTSTFVVSRDHVLRHQKTGTLAHDSKNPAFGHILVPSSFGKAPRSYQL